MATCIGPCGRDLPPTELARYDIFPEPPADVDVATLGPYCETDFAQTQSAAYLRGLQEAIDF